MHLTRTLLLVLSLLTVPVAVQAAESAGAGTVLNLKDSDITALISTVSRVTGRNFVIDPRVKAKVTVVSAKPMDAKQLYAVFESVLQVHGFVTVEVGGITKIVPEVNGKQDALVVDEDGYGPDSMVTQVVFLRHVSAQPLMTVLRQLMPQQAAIAVHQESNSLIITDRSANIDRLLKIIARVDRSDSDEVEVIRLKHAAASEVIRILTSLQNKGAPAQATGPMFAADDRSNSVLLSGDKSDRVKLRALIAHLDLPLEREGNTKVIYLRHASAKDLVPILKGVDKSQQDPAAAKQAAAATRVDVDIQADEATNALVITAPPDVMRNFEGVIAQLDIRRAQVLVEAIIAEVSEDLSQEIGTQFVVDGSPGGEGPSGFTNFTGGSSLLGAVASGGATLANTSGLTLGFGDFNRNGTDFAVLFSALAGDADTNILSTPRIMTLDNQEATINIGKEVPFVTGQYTNTGAATNTVNPFSTIERKNVGLTLKVTPQINEGNTVKLIIEQEVSSLAGSAEAAVDLITNTRSFNTTVLAEDGQTIAIGGLISEQLTDSRQKVPLLGDIPLLGKLFQYRSTKKSKSNLMVFLRPVVLRDADQASDVANEKYSEIRGLELQSGGKFGWPSPFRKKVPMLPEPEGGLINQMPQIVPPAGAETVQP